MSGDAGAWGARGVKDTHNSDLLTEASHQQPQTQCRGRPRQHRILNDKFRGYSIRSLRSTLHQLVVFPLAAVSRSTGVPRYARGSPSLGEGSLHTLSPLQVNATRPMICTHFITSPV